jgi:hypothetical protein
MGGGDDQARRRTVKAPDDPSAGRFVAVAACGFEDPERNTGEPSRSA